MSACAEGIAGQILGDLLHLLLIGDDAESLLEDRLQQRMGVFDFFLAKLASAIDWDVRHRAWAIERDQRYQVLEPVGAHVDQRLAHAAAFHLEHADRFAAAKHRVCLGVVQRDLVEIDRDPAPRDKINRSLEDRQRLEAQEIELHQPRLLDPFHVELGRRHRRLRIAVERRELDQRPIGDDDAGGMGGGVGIEPFEPFGDRQHPGDLLVGLRRFLQPRLIRHRLLECHRMGRILGHELGELVDLAERHFEHPADVAQDAARQERAESDDLRDTVGAVALAHIADHFVAPLLAEVDVEIGHRHPFGIEESLEQEAKPQRIEIGDGERPGDDRTRARAAPRSDRNALRLGPLDEVGDDEEIAGELHVDDDVELEGEAARVVLLGASGREAVRGKARAQAVARLTSELLLLVESGPAHDRKARQDRLSRQRAIGAAHCDLDAGLGRLGEIGEQFGHLRARLEPMLGRKAPALRRRHHRAFGDA